MMRATTSITLPREDSWIYARMLLQTGASAAACAASASSPNYANVNADGVKRMGVDILAVRRLALSNAKRSRLGTPL